jgi:hypothetical protein
MAGVAAILRIRARSGLIGIVTHDIPPAWLLPALIS